VKWFLRETVPKEDKSLAESGLLIYNLFKILYHDGGLNEDAYRYTG
jgi:hypothetical protein